MGELYTVWNFIRRHKIWIAVAIIVSLVGFIDENSYWHRRERIETMNKLRVDIRAKREQYERDSIALNRLETEREEVIRVARERYYMVRQGEDLFVVETPPEPADTAAEASQQTDI